MAAEGVTATAAVPAVAQRWIDAVTAGRHLAPPALRLLQVGGARLAPEIARRAEPVLGGTLQQVFGMAEGLLNYTRPDDPDDIKIETQGRPMCPDDEILVVDASDNPVPSGHMGALLTRGPYTPRGYYRADEHNARAFTPDGWYRTGDIVRVHSSGNLVVEGRDKDLINRGGEKISAEEVENLVYRLPGVARVAAIAKPDPDLGERVCVVVVVEPGTDLTLESVRAALTAMQVARYKLPEDLLVVDELAADEGRQDRQEASAGCRPWQGRLRRGGVTAFAAAASSAAQGLHVATRRVRGERQPPESGSDHHSPSQTPSTANFWYRCG